MKLLFIAMILSLNCFSQQKFGEFTFGSSPSENKNLSLEIDEGDTRLYSSKAKIDDIDFADINITFTKNKLSGIAMRTKNANGDKLLNKLKQTYGDPVVKSPSKMEWKTGKFKVFFEKDKSGKDASATIYTVERKS